MGCNGRVGKPRNASMIQANRLEGDPALATAANPVELRSHTTRPTGASYADAPAEPFSDSIEAGSLGYEVGGEIPPQGRQKFAGKGNGIDLTDAAAGETNPLVEPARQANVELVA